MEEQKDTHHHLYYVKFPPSPYKVQKQEYENQYRLLNHERIRIIEELAKKKGDEHKINKKLMWFTYLDNQIEWKMYEIRYLESCNQVDSIPVRPDRKRCHNRLIKKGRMNMEYVQQVQEQHLSLNKTSGIQELNDMIASMMQRIQHGNMKQTDEVKMCRQISKFKETKEVLIAQQPEPQIHRRYTRKVTSKRDINLKQSLQHDINNMLEDIENIKMKQMGRKTRVRRLKAEAENVRKNISCLKKKLESVNSKRDEAYKRAYELGEQKKQMNSAYNKYQSFKTYLKELAGQEDVIKLKYVCDKQVVEFMCQWNNDKAFRKDYEKRKLAWIL